MFLQWWHKLLAAYQVSFLSLSENNRISEMPRLTNTHTHPHTPPHTHTQYTIHNPALLAEGVHFEFYTEVVGKTFQKVILRDLTQLIGVTFALSPFLLHVWTWVSLEFWQPFCNHEEVLRPKFVLRIKMKFLGPCWKHGATTPIIDNLTPLLSC